MESEEYNSRLNINRKLWSLCLCKEVQGNCDYPQNYTTKYVTGFAITVLNGTRIEIHFLIDY